jgi:peptidoglycan/LPS O-acetylase OafA/YrhL
MQQRKFLSDILKRDGNNFDLFRLIAALVVIIGHAYAISPEPGQVDWVGSVLKFDWSGSLAVKFFFFLSGLLVTNSIVAKPGAYSFFIKRAFRIFPGLLICLLTAVLVVGPLFGKLPLRVYFSNPETWGYIYHNFFLYDMQWKLPGVFSDSKLGLNGSLWTLPFEVSCYVYLGIFHGLGLLKNKVFSNCFYLSMILVPFIAPAYLPTSFVNIVEARTLMACFSFGALLANNKDIVDISFSKVILIWFLAFALQDTAGFKYIFYIGLFYTILYLSQVRFVVTRLKLPFDASYGVYIYGFMIQQCVNGALPHIGVHGNQLISAPIALVVGILSWYFVEKPFIGLGGRLAQRKFSRSLSSVALSS